MIQESASQHMARHARGLSSVPFCRLAAPRQKGWQSLPRADVINSEGRISTGAADKAADGLLHVILETFNIRYLRDAGLLILYALRAQLHAAMQILAFERWPAALTGTYID